MSLKFLVLAGASLLAPFFLAPAAPVSNLVVFGDSLSDNGNAAIALGGSLAPLNYASNAFTDGPNTTPATAGPFGLWVDQFAAKLGVADPQPFLAGGANYAIATALTGTANVQDIGNQVAAFQLASLGQASSSSLYAFWGGANDLFHATTAMAGKTAADNLYGYILTLAGEGAKNFLWLNLPNLGLTPLGASQGAAVQAGLSAATAQFNGEWALDLAALKSNGVNVIGVDLNSLFNGIVANPAAYGFTNVTSPAQGMTGVNPNNYLFWDTEHPTTAADALIASDAYNSYLATVPEPGGVALALLGLGSLFVVRRKIISAR